MKIQHVTFKLPAAAFLTPGGKEAVAALAIIPALEDGASVVMKKLCESILVTGELMIHPLKAAIARSVNGPLVERMKAAIGQDIDVCPTKVGDMMLEIERHRWIEAEKARRDLWAEMNPQDPYAAAARDWYEKHYKGWSSVCWGGRTR